MDDFGGRTDDDLFADEFEPVTEESQPTVAVVPQPPAVPSHGQEEAQSHSQEGQPPAMAVAPPATSKPASSTPPSAPSAPRGLKQSCHAHNDSKAAPSPKPPRQQQEAPAAKATSPATPSSEPVASAATDPTTAATTPVEAPASSDAQPEDTATATTTQPTAPTAPSAGPAAPKTKADREARLKSGANPRTKLTEEELAAKMEQMRILSAEKTRRFEQAQRDESEHAVAYARGMEEARKRRAEEAEKRRKGEEERRRMDDERARNRERKLAAVGARAGKGGW
ncbi:hypothetical protein NKR19_g5767, partial [Coniochaeta hoffmannii]